MTDDAIINRMRLGMATSTNQLINYMYVYSIHMITAWTHNCNN